MTTGRYSRCRSARCPLVRGTWNGRGIRHEREPVLPHGPAFVRNPDTDRGHSDREHRQDNGPYEYRQHAGLRSGHRPEDILGHGPADGKKKTCGRQGSRRLNKKIAAGIVFTIPAAILKLEYDIIPMLRDSSPPTASRCPTACTGSSRQAGYRESALGPCNPAGTCG